MSVQVAVVQNVTTPATGSTKAVSDNFGDGFDAPDGGPNFPVPRNHQYTVHAHTCERSPQALLPPLRRRPLPKEPKIS